MQLLDAERGRGRGYASLRLSHDEVDAAVSRLCKGALGSWGRAKLIALERPRVFGVSVMYVGQVLAALTISAIARSLWPGVCVVWGGAHVTALDIEIASDPRYGSFVDRFVFGYAEETWVRILDAVRDGTTMPGEAVVAGEGVSKRAHDDASVVPVFADLDGYGGQRLTLPIQTSRGCAYGRCAFCTYPAVEGAYRAGSMAGVMATVDLAEARGAAVSIKDSLVVVPRLEEIAALIAGRVQWSACTKLSHELDGRFLRHLRAAGCATLEVGLETLTPQGQRLVNKRQPWDLFQAVISAAADAGVAMVVNYITGFPNADASEERSWFERVRSEVLGRRGLIAKVGHNEFQLERRSPMGRAPHYFGMQVTGTWPWESVMAWEPVPIRRR